MFLDTSGLFCCFDADDHRHEEAIEFYDKAVRRLTHNYVLAEFIAPCVARRRPRADSLAFAADVADDSEIELMWIDFQLHDEAMHLLQLQLGKSYSLCDAVSFLLMEQHELTDVLTTDRHFEQAGFRRLLRN